MFETADQARQLASELTTHYEYIAEASVPEDVRAERQGRRAGHHNMYASPGDRARWVVSVLRAR